MNKKRYVLISLLLVVVVLLAATGCGAGTTIGDLQTKSETVELGDAESVTVEIEMGAGDLEVSGGAEELLEADFTYNVDELDPEVTYSDGTLIIQHADTKKDMATLFDMDEYRNEWDLRFNEDVAMEMRIDIGAGRTDLNLGSLNLTSLDVKGGAGNVTVDLTGAPSLTKFDFDMGTSVLLMDLTGDWTDDLNAGISAGVGDLTLQLPGSVGVRVDVKEGAGKVSTSNLVKDGDTYTNDAFGKSEVTLQFDIKAGVGDINLEGEPAPAAAAPEPDPEAPAGEEETQEEEASMFDEDIAAQLQAVLEEAVASPDSNYPGVVLHVSSPELGSWSGAAGLGQVETNTAMRPHDKFRGGSLTKPFISVVILQLVEEGLLSLDDPMTAVLPENITGKFANSDQITVRMLLNHTGGLPDFMNLAGPEIVANLEKIWEEEEFLDFAASQEPWFAPGEAQAYSNTDYALLGMVIEEATGRTWREEMRERIFEPLNLENTFLPEPDDVTIPGDHAHGYNDFGAGVMDATEIANASVVGAAGGQSLITNAEDLSQFVTALAAGELFQEAATMEEMLTFVPWPDGNPLSFYLAGYGLGVTQATFGSGIDGVGHTGDTDGGYHAFVYYLPVQGMAISGAVNIKDYEAGFLLISRALEVLVPGYAAPQQSAEQPDLSAALQGLVDGQVQEQGILGMAMAVRALDGTVVGAGSGYSDPAGENAWSVDTQSAIGSVTKSFTAVVIAQLIEEGKLSLDDTIDTWFPDQPNGDKITVRMLLSHTSGLNKYINGPQHVDEIQAGKFAPEWAPLDLVAEANEAGPVDEPGSSDAHYANTNFVLLGLITEAITGNSWAQEVEARIIQPLDLQNTTFLSAEGILDTMVGGYAKSEDGYQNLLEEPWFPHASSVWSAGEIVATAADLMTFAAALFDGELVSSETLAVMAQPLGTDPDSGIMWGLGGGTIEGLPPGTFGMGGDVPGASAFYMGVLDTKLVAVALVNSQEGDAIAPSIAALEYLSSVQSSPQETPAAAPEQPDLGVALQGLLDSQVQEQDILGMAMALQLADGTVVGKGSGYSDPAEKEAWGIDTQTKIGSVTKLFTAAVIMQLVEEGKLSLDDTIDTWFPDQPNGEEITVRMLLTHNSGIGRFVTVPEVMEKSAETWAPMDLVAEANKAGSVGEPGGSEGHYSNANYILLALIAEEISGNSWDQEVQSRIIEPLDLKDTLYPGEEGFPDTVVGGYTKSDAGYENQLGIENPSFEWSAGALVSTVSDLTTFTSALFNGDLFESEETLNQMLEPLVPMDMGGGFVVQYGLGPARADVDGGPLWGHAGDNIGYAAFVGFDPATGSVVSTAVNTHGGDALGPSIAALQYLRSALGAGVEQEEPAMAFTPPITDAEGNEIPGSIAAIETVNLGGFEQTITLRGVDAANPVLLFLHGGPGIPSSPWVTWYDFQAELEEHFVVIHWDQRGQGKSFSEDLTPDDMHVENFVSDTLELTDILRQKFEQDKIFLWGHSWGSGLGFETLQVNAEPYHAYIASAVRPDWNSTQTMSYEWVLEQAQQADDSEAIQALEALQPYDPTDLEHVGTKNQFLSLYRGQDFYTEGLGDEYFNYVLSGQSPEYSAADVENTLAGQGFTRQTLLPEIIQSGYDLYTDFPVSPIPVYFLAGRHDYETPGELAEAYYDSLEAPAKNFTWFENSAHNMMYDEPDKTNQELIRIANEVLAESAQEGTAQPLVSAELLAELETYIEESREALNVPGAAVAIVQGGEIVYAEGFGVKELGSDDPVTADTVFSIGSTGKAMTSMMAASLVDDGIIAWDTPLVEMMPQFQLSDETATQQITLREAFAHTSGLPPLGLVLALSGLSPESIVEYLANVPLAAPPGELYAYHNEMNSVGAYAAAMAAGAEYGENLLPTYTELMQERVFDPLGMSSATFSAQKAAASPNHATPHFMGLNATLAETGFDVTPTHYMDIDTIAPAGTVRMNAPDVGRFLITMLSGGLAPDGSRVISTENLAETWTEQIAREPDPFLEKNGSGLGWSTVTYQGIPLVSKDGNIGGFTAQMAFIPEADTGIVVLANADVLGQMLSRNVQYRLVEMLFGLEPLIDQVAAAELEGIGGASEAYSQLAAVDPETVAPFLGSYDIEGEPYSVELRDGRLWVSMGELDFIELLAAPDGSYMAVSGGNFLFAPFQFVEGDDGQITMVISGQLELPKLD